MKSVIVAFVFLIVFFIMLYLSITLESDIHGFRGFVIYSVLVGSGICSAHILFRIAGEK